MKSDKYAGFQAVLNAEQSATTIIPADLNCICGHRFHGYLFADGLCFALTELTDGVWHVGNGIRGRDVSTLAAALDELIKLMQSCGLTVRGAKQLWALHIARSFRRRGLYK